VEAERRAGRRDLADRGPGDLRDRRGALRPSHPEQAGRGLCRPSGHARHPADDDDALLAVAPSAGRSCAPARRRRRWRSAASARTPSGSPGPQAAGSG
jgi:hypothetical protein